MKRCVSVALLHAGHYQVMMANIGLVTLASHKRVGNGIIVDDAKLPLDTGVYRVIVEVVTRMVCARMC